MRRGLLLVLLLLASAATAAAQLYDNSPDRLLGRRPFVAYAETGIDSVNVYNGNLMLDITLFAQPGRELSTGVHLTYDSKGWQAFGSSPQYGIYAGGWKVIDPVGRVFYGLQLVGCDYFTQESEWLPQGLWVDGGGHNHTYLGTHVYGANCEDPPYDQVDSISAVDMDGSVMSGNASTATLVFKDGSSLQNNGSSQRFITTNGNFLERGAFNYSLPYPNYLPASDTLGRSISYSTDFAGSTSPLCDYTLTTPVPYYQAYTITDANGQSRTYTLNFENNHFTYNPIEGCWEHLDGWLKSIDLPNGTSYAFDYDAWQGYLTKVTLPTGGYIEYEYTGGDTETAYGADWVVERRVSADGSTEKTWTYARSNSGGTRYVTITSPVGHEVTHTFNSLAQETQVDYRNAISESPQQTVTTTWTSGLPTQVDTVMGSVKRRTTRAWTGAVLLDYQEDSDWYSVSGSLIPRTKVDYSYSSSIRPSSIQLLAWNGSTYVSQGLTEYGYDEDSVTATSSSVPNKSTPASNRYNLSSVRRYKDVSNYIEEHFYYDDLGNVLEAVDALGHSTTFEYTDNFTDSTNHYSYAFPTTVTNELMQSVTSEYNYNTSLPTSVFDLRGLETEFTYDLMNRPVTVTEPNGRITTTTYTDATPKVTQEVLVASGITRKTETTLDKLFRPIQVKLFDPAGNVFADTEYDGDGRVKKVSAPYRSGTPVWTETTYDVLNRPLTITNSDSTTVTVVYSGNVVTTTDEAGNQRRQTSNSAGQLTKVEEPDPDLTTPLETTYSYYVFGPLYQVTQGAQTRTYTSDWLGRITQEVHPETGATSYTYNAAGLLTSRTDARSKVTSYDYDDINRPLTVTYSDSTPDVEYTYDLNGFTGFLTTVETAGVTKSDFEYDNAGQLTEETVTLQDGVSGTFTTAYTYDLGGRLLTVTYPSGRVVTQTYAASGAIASDRTASLTDSTTSTTLLQSVEDNAAGQLTNRTLGSGITETRTFNARNQLTRIAAAANSATLLDMGYGYGTGNDGRIQARTDGVQPEHSAGYTFDEIGRLIRVAGGNADWGNNWSIDWELDRWGNRTAQTPSIPMGLTALGAPMSAYANNKDNAWTYDAAGNATDNGSDTFAYDAENRLIQIGSSGPQYAYDGAGRRIKKTAGGVTTYYFYGLTGLMSEFDTEDTGVTEAASTDRLQYRVGEQTGTAVMLVASDGNARENNRVFPFGEPWNEFAASNNKDKFTTYQRDQESGEAGLDYAMARYLASRSGRFMTADPGHVGASVGDPQSWNAYAYGLNDPINGIDPSGLETYRATSELECPIGGKLTKIIGYMAWLSEAHGGKSGVEVSVVEFSDNGYECEVPDVGQVAQVGGGGGGANFPAAQRALQNAAVQVGNRQYNQRCVATLAAVGMNPAGLQRAAVQAVFLNGIGNATPYASIYANSPLPFVARAAAGLRGTIGDYFRANPGAVAIAQTGGHNIYINPGLINPANGPANRGLVGHEVIHNVTGFGDDDLQSRLGLPITPLSVNISNRLINDCF